MNNIKKIEKIIKNGSTSIDDYLTLGKLYLYSGKYQKIITLYNKALSSKINNLDKGRIYYEIAEVLQILNEFDDSVIYFHKAINTVQNLDDSWEALYIKGNSFYNLYLDCIDLETTNQYMEKAINYFRKLINKDVGHLDICHVYYPLADIYAKQNENDIALHYYNLALEKVIDDDTAKIQILSGIASVYGSNKQHDLSIQFFNRALEIATDLNSSKIYYDMGVVYFTAGLFDKANEKFKIALKNKRHDSFLKDNKEYHVLTLWHLGVGAYESGYNKNDVTNYLEELLAMIKDDHYYYANVNLTLGHFYSSINENGKAREYYNKVLVACNAIDDEIKMAKNCLSDLSHNG
jgi:tetratricopeptide (TPR) repeat protein